MQKGQFIYISFAGGFLFCLFSGFIFARPGAEPRVLHILGKYFTTELYQSPDVSSLRKRSQVILLCIKEAFTYQTVRFNVKENTNIDLKNYLLAVFRSLNYTYINT
jgi:hypothetical protein